MALTKIMRLFVVIAFFQVISVLAGPELVQKDINFQTAYEKEIVLEYNSQKVIPLIYLFDKKGSSVKVGGGREAFDKLIDGDLSTFYEAKLSFRRVASALDIDQTEISEKMISVLFTSEVCVACKEQIPKAIAYLKSQSYTVILVNLSL